MDTMNIHPTANMLPQLSDAEYAELRDDIRTRGLLEPILRKDGHVVDGRHRLRACNELGIEPRFDEYEGADIVAEIFSRNILRRHLTADQRAALIVKLLGAKLSAEAKTRMKSGVALDPALKSAQGGRTAEKIAAIAKVSRDTARKALRAHKDGAPASKKQPRPKPQKTLAQVVSKKLERLVNYFPVTKHRAVRLEIIGYLLSRYDGNKRIEPMSVTYPDGSTTDVREIIGINQ